jgi:hypothetical protein
LSAYNWSNNPARWSRDCVIGFGDDGPASEAGL